MVDHDICVCKISCTADTKCSVAVTGENVRLYLADHSSFQRSELLSRIEGEYISLRMTGQRSELARRVRWDFTNGSSAVNPSSFRIKMCQALWVYRCQLVIGLVLTHRLHDTTPNVVFLHAIVTNTHKHLPEIH